MHLVVGYGWQQEDAVVAETIAVALGTVAFEARQKISAGGPAVLASFADSVQAEDLAARMSQGGVPTLVVDTEAVRRRVPSFSVRRFELGSQRMQLVSFDGEQREIDCDSIELLLVAICNSGKSTVSDAEMTRKFSLGKTLLAGGVPMTKQVKTGNAVVVEQRDETLWLYAGGHTTTVFDRSAMNYEGLGNAMQFTRELNFTYLKNRLRRLAPRARYDDRLLKRAALVRLLGPALNPETDHDLAFEVLARTLGEQRD